MITNADKMLFRASGMGRLMTNDRSGKNMGETAKKYLLSAYADQRYGRFEEITSKFIEKGHAREQDAITLISRINKKFYKKNTIRLFDDFFTGEVDVHEGNVLTETPHTLDAKCSWSLITFLEAMMGEVNKDYLYQGHVYMRLTGARKHTIAYCLVNATASAILDEKKKLAYKMGIIDFDTARTNNDAFIKKCQQIERNHIFDLKHFEQENPGFDLDSDPNKWEWDIPMESRLHQITFDYDQVIQDAMCLRAMEGRNWINKNLFKLPVSIAA